MSLTSYRAAPPRAKKPAVLKKNTLLRNRQGKDRNNSFDKAVISDAMCPEDQAATYSPVP